MMDGAFILACIVLALVLFWFWLQRRKLHALLKVFCVVCLVVPATCQDEDTFIMGERPMVFPEPMMQAEAAIEDIFGNESDHMLFSSDWWPNSSILNLTA